MELKNIRAGDRLPRKLDIEFGISLPIHRGQTVDVSPKGFKIRCAKTFPKGTGLVVRIPRDNIGLNLTADISLKAEVVWVRLNESRYSSQYNSTMGMNIEKETEEFLDLYETVQTLADKERGIVQTPVEIDYRENVDFIQDYLHYLEKGYLAYRTDRPLDMNDSALVTMTLPDTQQVRLIARVLSVATPASGGFSGNIMEIQRFRDSPGRDALFSYLRKIRT